MRHFIAAVLAMPLLFCSPQTAAVPVAPPGSVSVVHTVAEPTAHAAPANAAVQQRIDAAAEVVRQATAHYSAGGATIDELGMWSERLFQAQKESLSGAALSDAATARVSQWKKIEALAQQRVAAGAATTSETSKAAYFRASAEIDQSRL